MPTVGADRASAPNRGNRLASGAILAFAALVALPLGAAASAASWAIVSSPNDSTRPYNNLLSVTCVNASDCWAVGLAWSGSGGYQALIEHNTGSGWAVVNSPTTGVGLESVTCVSASDCWAVGTTSSYQTLIEYYDGSAWSIVSSPNLPGAEGDLSSVTCVSASDCWAVGFYLYRNVAEPLIEHYDGTAWALSLPGSPPGVPVLPNELHGVTCLSPSDCWAVGRSGASQTLVEHYDGTLWSTSVSPNPPAAVDYLLSVTCVSANDCWSVGWSEDFASVKPPGPIPYQTLIEHYDGSAWSIVSSPNPTTDAQTAALLSVTCASAGDCWAVGDGAHLGGAPGPGDKTLIEHYDGTTWSIVSSPNAAGTQGSELSAVTCVSATDCWSVGASATGNPAAQTLIEQYGSTAPPADVPDLPWPPLALLAAVVGGLAVRARPLSLPTTEGER